MKGAGLGFFREITLGKIDGEFIIIFSTREPNYAKDKNGASRFIRIAGCPPLIVSRVDMKRIHARI
jgi:hypothetical protein